MVAINSSPSLAYKLNYRVSVGGSVNVSYGFLSLTRNLNGNDEKEKDHDWALRYRLGVLMDLTDKTRAGIAWTSKTKYDFNIDSKARLPDLANIEYDLPISAQVNAPKQIMLSLIHDLKKQWSVMDDLGWQGWSLFGSPQIAFAGHDTDKLTGQKIRCEREAEVCTRFYGANRACRSRIFENLYKLPDW